MRWRVAVGCASVAAVMVGEAHAQAPRYQLQLLQVEGQCFRADATALDDQGRTLGFNYGELCGQPPRGRIWTAGGPEGGMLLPTVPGAIPGCAEARDNGTTAWGMSNGRITGSVVTYDCEAPFNPRPLIWENGVTRELPLPAGWGAGEGRAINASGDVVGQLVGSTERMGFWPVDGAPTVIGPLHGMARDLNGSRQVVGCGSPGGGVPMTPFFWQNGQTIPLPPSNWSNQAGCANAINEAGVVVGESDSRPVYWQNGALKRLAPAGIPGVTVDISETGRMIGLIKGRPFYAVDGVVWDLMSLIDDESSFQPGLQGVARINGVDQIAAYRRRPPGEDGPFPDIVLLTPRPAVNQASVVMTSPWNGQPLSDLVTLRASASPSSQAGVAAVAFFQEGQLVGEDSSAPYSVEVDLTGTGPTYFYARVRDTAGVFASAPLRFATVSNSCQTVTTGQTISGSIGAQTGLFTVRWTQIPQANPMEGGFALAQGTPGGFSGTAAAVLFAADGQILVRNGSTYLATGVPYTTGGSHHLRMAVDVGANRYSVWLKLANQTERQLAANVAFRNAATQLDHWIARVDESSGTQLTICNTRVP